MLRYQFTSKTGKFILPPPAIGSINERGINKISHTRFDIHFHISTICARGFRFCLTVIEPLLLLRNFNADLTNLNSKRILLVEKQILNILLFCSN